MFFFLKLRHWELFLMLALPTALCFMFRIPFEPLVIASIGLFLMFVLFGWMFSVGAWCNSQLPESRRSSVIGFAAALILPIVYLLMYILLYLPEVQDGRPPDRPPLWFLPMHMLSLAGIFYGFWFTASKFKSLLEDEDADFMIFSSTFFLLFIFPLGIWIIQPNVNQLYLSRNPAEMYKRND